MAERTREEMNALIGRGFSVMLTPKGLIDPATGTCQSVAEIIDTKEKLPSLARLAITSGNEELRAKAKLQAKIDRERADTELRLLEEAEREAEAKNKPEPEAKTLSSPPSKGNK